MGSLSVVLNGTTDELHSYRSLKVLAAAAYASVQVTCKVHDTSAEVASQTTHLAKSLALTLPDGKTHIGGSTAAMMKAIALISPSSSLLGNSGLINACHVDSWIQFGWTALEVPLAAMKHHAIASSTETITKNISGDFSSAINLLNRHLRGCEYLVGDNVTNADIAICCVLYEAASSRVWDPRNCERTEVFRWYNNVVTQDFFLSGLDIIKLST